MLVTLVVAVLSAGSAGAVIGAADVTPAATLLFPYFEADLDDPSGATTLIAIRNSSATAALAHVTLWTDMGVPTLAFDVYLTGFDIQTINVRDLFNNMFPVTASAGQDPSRRISPQGLLSQHINFASCTGIMPYFNPALYQPVLEDLRRVHTGKMNAVTEFRAIAPGRCAGRDWGDNVARGFITVDTVTQCSWELPNQAVYFSGVTSFQNILLGDYMFVHPANNFAQGEPAVHVEASSPNDPPQAGATFYGRLVGWTGIDRREPLPTAWAVPYYEAGGTQHELIVWRDPAVNQTGFICQSPPTPMGHTQAVSFDIESNPTSLGATPLLPIVAQRIDAPAALASRGGWAFLNLNTTSPAFPGAPNVPVDLRQSWVVVVDSTEGRFATGMRATQLGHPGGAYNPLVGQ